MFDIFAIEMYNDCSVEAEWSHDSNHVRLRFFYSYCIYINYNEHIFLFLVPFTFSYHLDFLSGIYP